MGKAPKEQITTNRLDPRAEKFRNEIYNRSRDVANERYTEYGGPTVAGVDPRTAAAAAGMGGMADQYRRLGDRAAGMTFGSNLPSERNFNSGVDPNRAFGNFDTELGMSLDPYQKAGATGAAALGGDSAAISSLMNPYQDEVINRMSGQFDRLRGNATRATNDAATRSGAFGGSRHAVTEGARLGEIDRAEGDSIAGLLSGGYNDAMGRASGAANLGLGAGGLGSSHTLGAGGLRLGAEQAGADYHLGAGDQRLRGQGMAADYALGAGDQRLRGQGMYLDANGQALDAAGRQQGVYQDQAQMGDYYRNIQQAGYDDARNRFNERRGWNERGLNIMTGAMSGIPYGTTQSQPLHSNKFGAIAGGAATGAQIGGPWGAVAGGVGGLLFG